MIPILFAETATSFTSNGIGRLRCESAYVEKVRNGEYELDFTVPITDKHFADIHEGMFVVATHDNTGNKQPFKIYGREAPMNGLVRFRAHHKSQELSNVIVNPFTATSASEAIARIKSFCINDCPYEFWTDKTTVAPFKLDQPASVRSILGGTKGSFLDAFGGGEYEFDGNTVRLWNEMGADNSVTIRYGKNLVDIKQEIDALGVYNAIVPFWAGEVNEQHVLVMLDERMVTAEGVENPVPVVMDMSQDFREQPTQAQLRSAAQSFLSTNRPWIPNQNITIDFVQLWQTEEYKQYAPLQRVGLCDIVTVYYKALGITGKAKVIRTRYNVLLDRYDEVELGNPKTSFADTIKTDFDTQIEQAVASMQGFMDAAIENATSLITGGKGGYIYFGYNAQGKPEELLILDTDSLSTATNIIRINKNGIGFSNNGGTTYRSAWTIDGHFVADFIDTGTLNANIVRAGTITDARGLNFWNLDTGDLRMAASTQIGTGGTTVGDLTTQDEVTAAINTGINDYRQEVNAIVEDLQDQIDGVIDTYYYAYEPTLNNYPANEWTTEALRNEHEGDLFMDTTTGRSYRFLKQNNVWQWVEIPDTAAAQALQVAQEAQNLANTKRRVFTNTPYTPYDVGDLWVQGATGDIFKCKTARASGNYTANDWDKASKYTDDTVANQALEAIETMEIGGRNLFINTNVPDVSTSAKRPRLIGQTQDTSVTGSAYIVEHGIGIRSTASGQRPMIRFGANSGDARGMNGLVAGKIYTISFDCKWKVISNAETGVTTPMTVFLYDDRKETGVLAWRRFDFDTAEAGVESSGRCEATFTLPDNVTMCSLLISASSGNTSLYNTGDYFELQNFKLESGNKATAWTPAPEDIDSEINGINVYLATLQGQVDGKAETFYQADDPSTGWTAAEKEAHEGDLWYRTGDGVTLRYSGSAWQEQDIPNAVFDKIDGKAQIFVAQPTPPYNIGDLWVQGSSGDIMRCSTARTSGNYTASDWTKASKYTDDTAVTNLDNSLTQQEVFNRLTNNGQVQGIYLQNGLLYINASYIASGTLSADLITAGVLRDAVGNNYWNLVTGDMSITGDVIIKKTVSTITNRASFKQVSFNEQSATYTQYGLEIDSIPSTGSSHSIIISPAARGGFSHNAIVSKSSSLFLFSYGSGSASSNYCTAYLQYDGFYASAFNGSSHTLFAGFVGSSSVTVNIGESSGSVNLRGQNINLRDVSTTSNAPNMYCGGSLKTVYKSSSSSKRYKRDISDVIPSRLDPHRLYSIPIKTYIYRDEYLSPDDRNSGKRLIGFIAEDIDEAFPAACQYDEEGRPEMWNINVFVPSMLKLIQEQKQQIDTLETRVAELEEKLEKLMSMMSN